MPLRFGGAPGRLDRVAERVVRCPTCQDSRPVNGFGRCVVCGNFVADVQLATPSALRWHLRRHASGYAGVLLLAAGFAIALLLHDAGAMAALPKMTMRLSLLAGGGLVMYWIKDQLVG